MKALFVAFGLCVGQSVWADPIEFKTGNKIGAENNSDGWYGASSEIFTIGHHQTLTLRFKTYTATDDQLAGKGAGGTDLVWGSYMTHVLNFWDGNYQNLFVRGDGYGWKQHDGEHADSGDPADFNTDQNPSNTTYTYNQKNFGDKYRNIIGTGADVVLTIARYGKELRISEEITRDGNTNRHYFVGKFGTSATADIWCQMTVERAHIEVSEDKTLSTSVEDTPVTGTLIGTLNNGLGGIKDNPYQSFSLQENGSLSLHFKNYTNRVENWFNWVLELTPDNVNYLDLRADNWGWGTYWNSSNCSITGYDWNTFKDDMNGADVVINIVRSGSSIAITATMTSTASKVFTETYNVTNDAFASGAITVNLCCEGGHLDLLPVSKAVTSAGWATYCSPYALDLEHATGLTDAYIVTGGENGVLTKTSVKGGTVPANTGLLLKADEGTVTMPIVGTSATDVSANKLIGKTAAYNLDANDGYVLMATGSNGLGFYKNANIFEVGANTAYLPANFAGGAGAREFFSLDDDATAISETKSQQPMANGLFFDLQGRKVAQPQKGLYIVNGKKVVMK